MVEVTLDEALGRLGELIRAARSGEAVVIVSGGTAVRLVPVQAPADIPMKRRKAGSAAGQIRMAPDFDAPLPDFADYER